MLAQAGNAPLHNGLLAFLDSKIIRCSANFDFSGFHQCQLKKGKGVDFDFVSSRKFNFQDADRVIFIVKIACTHSKNHGSLSIAKENFLMSYYIVQQ